MSTVHKQGSYARVPEIVLKMDVGCNIKQAVRFGINEKIGLKREIEGGKKVNKIKNT